MIFYKVAYYLEDEGDCIIAYFSDLSNAENHKDKMNDYYIGNMYYIEEITTKD